MITDGTTTTTDDDDPALMSTLMTLGQHPVLRLPCSLTQPEAIRCGGHSGISNSI